MLRRLYDYGTEMSDALTMLVTGLGVLLGWVVGLPPTIVNLCVGGLFVLSGLIVMQGRRLTATKKELGESVIRWGFWLFSLCAGVFVVHNALT